MQHVERRGCLDTCITKHRGHAELPTASRWLATSLPAPSRCRSLSLLAGARRTKQQEPQQRLTQAKGRCAPGVESANMRWKFALALCMLSSSRARTGAVQYARHAAALSAVFEFNLSHLCDCDKRSSELLACKPVGCNAAPKAAYTLEATAPHRHSWLWHLQEVPGQETSTHSGKGQSASTSPPGQHY